MFLLKVVTVMGKVIDHNLKNLDLAASYLHLFRPLGEALKKLFI